MSILTDNKVKIIVACIALVAAITVALIPYLINPIKKSESLLEVQQGNDCVFYPIGWQRSIGRGGHNMSHCIKRCIEKDFLIDGVSQVDGFGDGCSIPLCSLLCETRWNYSDLIKDDINKREVLPNYDAAGFSN